MNITESIKALSLIGEIRSTKWTTIMLVVDCIQNDKTNKTVIVSKEWGEKYKHENTDRYPLDLSIRDTWSTYDDTCIDLTFSVKEKKLNCYAKIYNGMSYDGRRTDLRFEAEIILPNKFIKRIESLLEYEFRYFLERQYSAHLELKKREWMTEMRTEILK